MYRYLKIMLKAIHWQIRALTVLKYLPPKLFSVVILNLGASIADKKRGHNSWVEQAGNSGCKICCSLQWAGDLVVLSLVILHITLSLNIRAETFILVQLAMLKRS